MYQNVVRHGISRFITLRVVRRRLPMFAELSGYGVLVRLVQMQTAERYMWLKIR